MKRIVHLLLWGSLLWAPSVSAQGRTANFEYPPDPRGPAEFTICSQNLANYGSLGSMKARSVGFTMERLEEKEEALVQRFTQTGCDVIAVQEVIGRTTEDAEAAIKTLAGRLARKSHRPFTTVLGVTNDKFSQVGFLIAEDRADVFSTLSYRNLELPKLVAEEKPRQFARVPLELQLRVKPRKNANEKHVVLVNFHFKSQRGGAGDPAELDWETWRMQMAEGLRRIVENRHERHAADGSLILVLLGDRNSHFDTASAKILEGVLTLNKFRGSAPCRLSKRGVPLCPMGSGNPQKFFSVLTGDPQLRMEPGTFQYKNVYSWLDDILLTGDALRLAWKRFDSDGQYLSGVIRAFPAASDHALVYVRLNW